MPRTSTYARMGEEARERVRVVARTEWRALSNRVAVACGHTPDSEVAGKQPSHNQYLGEAIQ